MLFSLSKVAKFATTKVQPAAVPLSNRCLLVSPGSCVTMQRQLAYQASTERNQHSSAQLSHHQGPRVVSTERLEGCT